jgi:hypothetical protein
MSPVLNVQINFGFVGIKLFEAPVNAMFPLNEGQHVLLCVFPKYGKFVKSNKNIKNI